MMEGKGREGQVGRGWRSAFFEVSLAALDGVWEKNLGIVT